MNQKDPCYKCTERKVAPGYNCHSDCPRYAKAKKENDEKKKAIRQQKEVDTMVDSVLITAAIKTKREKPKQRVWKG